MLFVNKRVDYKLLKRGAPLLSWARLFEPEESWDARPVLVEVRRTGSGVSSGAKDRLFQSCVRAATEDLCDIRRQCQRWTFRSRCPGESNIGRVSL